MKPIDMAKYKWASDIISIINSEAYVYRRVPCPTMVHEFLAPPDVNFVQMVTPYLGWTLYDFIKDMHNNGH